MRVLLILISLWLTVGVSAQINSEDHNYRYTVASKPWDESLGNHRAIIHIPQAGEVVSLKYVWRRSDKDVDKRALIIICAETGDTVKNIKRMQVDNESCQLQFGPVLRAGTYHFYYLPYQVQLGHGFYSKGYLQPEKPASEEWLKKAGQTTKTIEAQVTDVQSRTDFDSFYPMGIVALNAEKGEYERKYPRQLFYLFPEDRKYPIRMQHHLPAKWMAYKQGKEIEGDARPNEYYVFQIGVWASGKSLEGVNYKITGLRNGEATIPYTSITCFNTEGVNPYGEAFKKHLTVKQNTVQALWFGIDIPASARTGVYEGAVTIETSVGETQTLPVRIRVGGDVLVDRGDSEIWRHSRLRWLNSTLGIQEEPTRAYTNVKKKADQINVLGRSIVLDKNTQLPEQIHSWQKAILQNPISFSVHSGNEELKVAKQKMISEQQTKGSYNSQYTTTGRNIRLDMSSKYEFDGWVNYRYVIRALDNVTIDDVKLDIPMRKDVASYVVGMGLPGQDVPQHYEGKWDVPEKTVDQYGVSIPTSKKQNWLWPFDSFWLGNAKAGLHCELRGTTYSGPLLNLYKPAYPDSWHNGGKGGFTLNAMDKNYSATVYSGSRTLAKGDSICFEFAFIITPVKETNYSSQFLDRYYHNGEKPIPTDEDVEAGVKIINVHHANELNPVINYPFLTVDKMKDFTRKWHAQGCKVKLYYTVRELTSAIPEIWALRSLDTEILRGGSGGGFPWCQEHFVTNYTPQWYHHFGELDDIGIMADASVLTAEGDSRWYNYYIEGLSWMVKNLDIDGLYLDDVTFDRRILKRMRRAMDDVKSGCLIDLHSNTGFSKGPVVQYMEFFPYVDKVWFGESFIYDKMTPANWLVESSGIPFGLMGDMLHAGGNRWLGMQYGMTVRHPWYTEGVVCDPRTVWKVWDKYRIHESQMSGFWDEVPLAKTSHKDVLITTYLNGMDATLLSVGNYTDKAEKVKIDISRIERQLGKKAVRLYAPPIADFQDERSWGINDPIDVEPRKGLILVLEFK